jgi:beta-lactamase class A
LQSALRRLHQGEADGLQVSYGDPSGDARLRAGFPADWMTGDKTGTNGDKAGNANDIAITWSPDRGAIIVTAFCEIPGISSDERNAVIAEIGRIATDA